MKRVVFSVFLDLPTYDDEPRASNNMEIIKKYYDAIVENHRNYAHSCDANYVIFNYNAGYEKFYQKLKSIDPTITHYQTINNFKIHCLDLLKHDYNEILYLDLDVFVNTEKNIFEEFDLSKGICLAPQTLRFEIFKQRGTLYGSNYMGKLLKPENYYIDTRAVEVKYAIAKTLLIMDDIFIDPEIWNTGIVAINADHVNELDYFGKDFNRICEDIIENRTDEIGLFAPELLKVFSINNESIISYLTYSKNIDVHVLGDDWHHIYDDRNEGSPNRESNLIHIVNKKFEDILL